MKPAMKKTRSTRRPARARTIPWPKVRDRILGDPEVCVIGSALAAARKLVGLTQEEVAMQAVTTQSAIARLEGGRSGLPSVALLDRITRAVGLRVVIQLERERAAGLRITGAKGRNRRMFAESESHLIDSQSLGSRLSFMT